MRLRLALVSLVCVGALLSGCGPSELTNADIEAKKKELSKENFDKSMAAAGKQDQVELSKKADADRKEAEQGR